ncbi:MAG: transcriptional repressor [Clostridia bacterium]|nr:transcriptional repressor [Clostridia bacterium]
MKEYRTEQKTELLSYLSTHADRAFTLSELADEMQRHGVGKSTVYRLVAGLYEAGSVRRYAKEGGRGYTYRYLRESACTHHLHLECLSCGRVIHLGREQSALFEKSLRENHEFALDDSRTLLYGKCAACQKGDAR